MLRINESRAGSALYVYRIAEDAMPAYALSLNPNHARSVRLVHALIPVDSEDRRAFVAYYFIPARIAGPLSVPEVYAGNGQWKPYADILEVRLEGTAINAAELAESIKTYDEAIQRIDASKENAPPP